MCAFMEVCVRENTSMYLYVEYVAYVYVDICMYERVYSSHLVW